MSDFQTPSSHPYLTTAYIRAHAWYPVDHWVDENRPKFRNHQLWGRIPCKSRTEYRAGDIMIFDEYKTHEMGDRFRTVSQSHIDEVFSGKPENTARTKAQLKKHIAERTDLLPVGVVVHPPEDFTQRDSLAASKTIKDMG